MHPVDDALAQARQLLGTLITPEITPPSYGDALPPPDGWSGEASEQAHSVTTELDGHREQISAAHKNAAATVSQANEIVRWADSGLSSVESAWEQDKATLGPLSDTAQGQAALMQAGQQRIGEATQVIEHTATQYQQAAGQIQALGAGLPLTPPIPQDPLWPEPPQPEPKDEGMPRSTLEGIHGTDSKDMPIVKAPGELGPPNTGLFPGGTNFEEAYPGSGVWIPSDQISGKMFYQPPGSDVLPPYGYEEIGRLEDGTILYWPEPSNYPQPYIPDLDDYPLYAPNPESGG